MKTINAYKFSELNESVQERVLGKFRDINTDCTWYEHVIEEWKGKLKDIGFLKADISFCGFYHQGCGCSFLAELDLEQHLINEFEPLTKEDTAFICKENCYARNYRKWQYEQDNYLSSDELDKLSNSFIEYINNYKIDLEHEMYIALEKEYEWLTSNESVRETLEMNEYHFLENGTMA
jgi:uncharacterized protein YbcC (UPF0753/DUF2309 family)